MIKKTTFKNEEKSNQPQIAALLKDALVFVYGAVNGSIFAHLPMFMEISFYVTSDANDQSWQGKVISFLVHLGIFAVNTIILKKTAFNKFQFAAFSIGWVSVVTAQFLALNPDIYWMILVESMNLLSLFISYVFINRNWVIKFKIAEPSN